MKLKTAIIPIHFDARAEVLEVVLEQIQDIESTGQAVLRWGLVKIEGQKALLEVATITDVHAQDTVPFGSHLGEAGHAGIHVAVVIPTGVGASIGGFIGDAGPVARTLESVADSVIVHPNVVNAADFYAGGQRSLYVDGLTLDRFFAGRIRLDAPRPMRIGLLLDRLEPTLETQLVNAANAMHAVYGIEIVGYVVCEEKIRVHVSRSQFGHFVGEVENPDVLFQAVGILDAQGANAIAVVTAIDGIREEDVTSHYRGEGPNPIGAVEALISRAVTWKTGLPCAHAPAFVEGLGESQTVVDPRTAAEVASGSGLPCTLQGLAHIPRIVQSGGIGVNNLSTIIVPFGCAGGPPALAAYQFQVPLLAVKSNQCAVGVPANLLHIQTLTVVENYAEAIAFVACQKAGVSWDSISRPMSYLKNVSATSISYKRT